MVGKVIFNKKGQITIFIILALILVVSILLIFILLKKPDLNVASEQNPQQFIDSCVTDYVNEALDILGEQGGDISPEGSVMFKGSNITYLCYTSSYYIPCTNQRPMLREHMESEITKYIKPKVKNCFNELKTKLEGKSYGVSFDEPVLSTKIQPDQVEVNIVANFKMTKNDKTREFSDFQINVISPIAGLLDGVHEIVDSEFRFCNFDIRNYMFMHPRYDLDKFRTGDSDVIYTISDIQTNKKFKFAIRSCALPPGF